MIINPIFTFPDAVPPATPIRNGVLGPWPLALPFKIPGVTPFIVPSFGMRN